MDSVPERFYFRRWRCSVCWKKKNEKKSSFRERGVTKTAFPKGVYFGLWELDDDLSIYGNPEYKVRLEKVVRLQWKVVFAVKYSIPCLISACGTMKNHERVEGIVTKANISSCHAFLLEILISRIVRLRSKPKGMEKILWREQSSFRRK